MKVSFAQITNVDQCPPSLRNTDCNVPISELDMQM